MRSGGWRRRGGVGRFSEMGGTGGGGLRFHDQLGTYGRENSEGARGSLGSVELLVHLYNVRFRVHIMQRNCTCCDSWYIILRKFLAISLVACVLDAGRFLLGANTAVPMTFCLEGHNTKGICQVTIAVMFSAPDQLRISYNALRSLHILQRRRLASSVVITTPSSSNACASALPFLYPIPQLSQAYLLPSL
jgi:hypothetical protein